MDTKGFLIYEAPEVHTAMVLSPLSAKLKLVTGRPVPFTLRFLKTGFYSVLLYNR